MTIRIAYTGENGLVHIVTGVDGYTLDDVVAISVPVVVSKGGELIEGVTDPVRVAKGDHLDPRIAAMNSGIAYEQVPWIELPDDALPTDRMFRAAWKLEAGSVVECPAASKPIAHIHRRTARESEFAPLDKAVVIAPPGSVAQNTAEAARQVVRDKYAEMQNAIDSAETIEDLREILK